MGDRGPGIGRVGGRFGGILPAIAMYLVEIFSLRVVWLQIVIADRPRRRDSAVVAQLAEVFFPQAEERRAVELGVAAYAIICVRMKFFPVLVEPGFFGV